MTQPYPDQREPASRHAEPRIHPRDLGRRGVITPFARLARSQALSVAGEALFAIGLANTVFFSTDPNQSRLRVALYLVLTFLPFAVAGPLIGPTLDRAAGGRRWVLFGASLARAVLSFLLLRDLDDLYFYPEAFLMLVLSKVSLISKAALVPSTVRSEAELVEANSKLSSLGALSAVGGGIVAGVILGVSKIPFLGIPKEAVPLLILASAGIAFLASAFQALSLPPTRVAVAAPGAAETAELHSAGILLASSSQSVMRGIMGFLTFLLAFWVKNDDRPLAWIGVLVAMAQIGYFTGSLLAPRVRRLAGEERMMQLSMGAIATVALAVLALRDVGGGLVAASLLAFVVGMAPSISKQAFDSLVQRDAPDANHGRSFAKFETRFQLFWVFGAVIPVVIPLPLWVGFTVIAVAAIVSLVTYAIGLKELTEVVAGRRMPRPRKPSPWARAASVVRRRDDAAADDPGLDVTGAWAAAPVVAADDPTLLDAAVPGAEPPPLLGQRDAPLPDALYEVPEGGLFDPAAPPPPRGAGYHRQPVAPDAPTLVAGATSPQPPGRERLGSPADEADRADDAGDLELIELPGGGIAYGAVPGARTPPDGLDYLPPPVERAPGVVELPLPFTSPAEPAGDTVDPVEATPANADWYDAEPHWRDDEDAAGPDTGELPPVPPPAPPRPPLEEF